jgi:hypothetical protein
MSLTVQQKWQSFFGQGGGEDNTVKDIVHKEMGT